VVRFFAAPHKHLVVDVTVTSARTNSIVTAVGLCFLSLAGLRWGLNKLSLILTSALRPPLACLPFSPFVTITPLLLRTGAGWLMAVDLVDRWAILVANRHFPGVGGADSRSIRSERCTRIKKFVRRFAHFPLRRLLGDVRRRFMHRLFVILHSTLGSYPRDALHEGGASIIACLPAPRA
jgi:hypothetical protein